MLVIFVIFVGFHQDSQRGSEGGLVECNDRSINGRAMPRTLTFVHICSCSRMWRERYTALISTSIWILGVHRQCTQLSVHTHLYFWLNGHHL